MTTLSSNFIFKVSACLNPSVYSGKAALKYIGLLVLLMALPMRSYSVESTPKNGFLKPYTAKLSVTIKGMPVTASGQRELKQNHEGDWELTHEASMGIFMQVSEFSRFQLNGDKVTPQSYRYKRSGLVAGNKNTQADFNWQNAQIIWQEGKKNRQMPLPKTGIDNLSYQPQLRIDLATGKKELNYLITDETETYQRSFIIEKEEILETGAGRFNAVKLRIKRENSTRETYIWFAKDLNYFFLKMLQIEGGYEISTEVSSAIIDGVPLKGI